MSRSSRPVIASIVLSLAPVVWAQAPTGAQLDFDGDDDFEGEEDDFSEEFGGNDDE